MYLFDLFTVVSSFVAPIIFTISINIHFFTNKQITYSLLFTCIAGSILFFSAQLLFAILGLLDTSYTFWIFSFSPFSFFCTIMGILAIFIFGEKNIADLSKNIYSLPCIFFTTCSIIALFFSVFTYTLLTINAVIITVSIFDAIKNNKKARTPIFSDASIINKPAVHKKLVHKPNIYILLLESVHSSDVLQNSYKHKGYTFEKMLTHNGFTIHAPFYSNFFQTRESLATLVNMNLMYDAPPEFITTLKSNGYVFHFFDELGYILPRYLSLVDFSNYSLPRYVARLYSLFCPLFVQSRLMRKLTKNIDPLDTSYLISGFTQLLTAFTAEAEKKSPRKKLTLLHFGADHAHKDFWYENTDFESKYIRDYSRGLRELRAVLNIINTHDPDALVIAVGDHGAYRLRNIWSGQGMPTDVIRERGSDPQSVANDHFKVLCAWRWPNHKLELPPSASHVNLLRHILAYLTQEALVREECAPNISIVADQWIAVRDARPLDPWEPLPPGTAQGEGTGRAHDAMGALREARLLLHEGKPDAAYAIAQAIPVHSVTDATLLSELGKVFFSLKKLALSNACFAKAEKYGGPQYALERSRALAAQFFPRKAARLTAQAIERNATAYGQAVDDLAFYYFAAGEYSACVRACDAAFSRFRVWCESATTLPHICLKSLAMTKMHGVEAAVEFLEGYNDPQTALARQINAALLLVRHGRYDLAVPRLDCLVRQKMLGAAVLLCRIFEKYGFPDKGLETFHLWPDTKMARIYQGMASLRQNKTAEGVFVEEASKYIDKYYHYTFPLNITTKDSYIAQNNITENIHNPIMHYLLYGFHEMLNLSPLFDNIFTLSIHQKIFQDGIDPLFAYVRSSLFFETSPFFMQNNYASLCMHADKANFKPIFDILPQLPATRTSWARMAAQQSNHIQ